MQYGVCQLWIVGHGKFLWIMGLDHGFIRDCAIVAFTCKWY